MVALGDEHSLEIRRIPWKLAEFLEFDFRFLLNKWDSLDGAFENFCF